MCISSIRAAAIEALAILSACNAAFIICSALLFLSLTPQGEIAEAAPGQSVGAG
jgi:predicted TIM-barrel enzyme